MRIKWVFYWDTIQGFLRVGRLMWERGTPGDGSGYSVKLSFALDPRIFQPLRTDALSDWRLTVFGLRVHYCRSYGGVFT